MNYRRDIDCGWRVLRIDGQVIKYGPSDTVVLELHPDRYEMTIAEFEQMIQCFIELGADFRQASD